MYQVQLLHFKEHCLKAREDRYRAYTFIIIYLVKELGYLACK